MADRCAVDKTPAREGAGEAREANREGVDSLRYIIFSSFLSRGFLGVRFIPFAPKYLWGSVTSQIILFIEARDMSYSI